MDEEPVEHKDPVARTLMGIPRAPSAQAGSQSEDVTDRLRAQRAPASPSRKNTLAQRPQGGAPEAGGPAGHRALAPPWRTPPSWPWTQARAPPTSPSPDSATELGVGPRRRVSSLRGATSSQRAPRHHRDLPLTTLRGGRHHQETYDDGTVLVLARHDEEQVLGTLGDLSLPRVGDALVADLAVRMALRPVVRSRSRTVWRIARRRVRRHQGLGEPDRAHPRRRQLPPPTSTASTGSTPPRGCCYEAARMLARPIIRPSPPPRPAGAARPSSTSRAQLLDKY